MELIKKESEYLVSAKELYKELGIKRMYATWIKESIERADLQEIEEYLPLKESIIGAGRPSFDYLLKREAAITIIVMSGGQFAKDLRKTVIGLYTKHDTGLAFTAEQITALFDLSKAMTLVSNMKEAQNRHFAYFNDKYKWCDYHSTLLGYSTKYLIEEMKKINKKHKSNRTSLMKLDPDELVRTGMIDLMMGLGKTEQFAVNVGNLCKQISQRAKFQEEIWDDTQYNPLGLNIESIKERKALLNNTNTKKLN